jgi:hypothetical protein
MAQVSGIEVRFSGNTADLEKSVGRANSAISGFAKSAAAGLAGALSVGVFVAAGKAAINYADSIGKMSQKIGMTTEELSKLNYAAKLSDVSLGELQGGLQLLSKNMEAGSDGLAALGISATTASGELRSTNEVMQDVAEAFAGMEDGAGKTALAMNIFGRSGANLIPLLNSGRKGLADMAGEAQSLGAVISQDAAKSAERFNDNLTKLNTAMSGIVQQIVGPLLPRLIELSQKLLDLVVKNDLATKASALFGEALRLVSITAATTYKEIYSLAQIVAVLGKNLTDSTTIAGSAERWREAFANIRQQAEETKKTIDSLTDGSGFSASREDVDSLLSSIDGSTGKSQAPRLPGSSDSKGKGAKSPVPGVAPSQEVGMFFIDRLEAIRDGFKSEREVLEEEYALNRNVLQNALLNGQLKDEQEYYDLSQKLAEEHAAALAAIQQASISQQLSDLSSGFGSMASAFQNGGKKMLRVSKAFAAAQAIVATIQAAVDAMKNPALIDPASKFAAYAAVFAKGMSAVAAIRGVSDSGGGGGGGGGGGRGGGRGGGGSSAPAAASPTTTFQFTLMNDPMGFGEKFARQFIDQLNATQRNGGQIRGVIA